MPIINFRLNFTGTMRRDVGVGILAGLLGWLIGGMLFGLVQELGLPSAWHVTGLGLPPIVTARLLFALLTGCLMFELYTAAILWLSRRPYARVFLAAMVVTAASVPPLLGWSLLVVQVYLHG